MSKFSPRITRSQTSKDEKHFKKEYEPNVQGKESHKKVDEVEKAHSKLKARVHHKNLETIYEDPVWKNGNKVMLGKNKIKRCIYLNQEFKVKSKQKSKLRKMKIKRLGKRLKPLKMSHEEFMKKMLKIENFLNGNDPESQPPNEKCDDVICNSDSDKKYDIENTDSSESDSGRNKELQLGNVSPE